MGEYARGLERERDIYIYLSIMGCFFSPNAFENAPGHAFENGVRSVRGREIPIFIVFRGYRQAAVSAAGLSNMQRCPG